MRARLHADIVLDDALRSVGASHSSLWCPDRVLQDCVVKMKLVAPPLYVLATQTLDKQKGIEVLTHGEACAVILRWDAAWAAGSD